MECINRLLVPLKMFNEGFAEQGVIARLKPGSNIPGGLPQEEVSPLPASLLPAKALRTEALSPVPLQLDCGQHRVLEVLSEKGEAEGGQVGVLEAPGPLLPYLLDSLLDEGAAAAEGEECGDGHEGGRELNGEQLCGSEGQVGGCYREEPCEVLLVLFYGWKK